MKKKLPLGISDFKEIITGNYAYVDKTLLIKELVEGGIKVTLIPRPRRFGKTINLSMLKYFFEKPIDSSKQSQSHLFDGLAIASHPEIMEHQGKYPVIFMTFKDVKQASWHECLADIKRIIGKEFERHSYLLASPMLSPNQKLEYQEIIALRAPKTSYRNALKDLSEYLAAFHGAKTIILLDEYDLVIQEAYLRDSHALYDHAITFMRTFLGGGLKDNTALQQGIITGILRIAKESIFSGLNNLKVCSLVSDAYADKFGLLEHEVADLLKEFGLAGQADNIRRWYNGYRSGKHHIYNPWSIITCIENKGKFGAYWVNTSQDGLIKKLIQLSGSTVKEDFELLVAGKTITSPLAENIVFQALESDSTALWNFLLFTGYLTFTRVWNEQDLPYVELAIPNAEINSLYRTVMTTWFTQIFEIAKYQRMLQNLVQGNMLEFRERFTDFVGKTLSSFDVGGTEPEKFYHALVLGMLVSLENTHEIKSNRESGFGRYDVMLIPKDSNLPGIIIEFKKVSTLRKETLETAAQAALAQIAEKNYAAELHTRGITHSIPLAIVFQGRDVLVREGPC